MEWGSQLGGGVECRAGGQCLRLCALDGVRGTRGLGVCVCVCRSCQNQFVEQVLDRSAGVGGGQLCPEVSSRSLTWDACFSSSLEAWEVQVQVRPPSLC